MGNGSRVNGGFSQDLVQVLGQKFRILDDGFVRVVDVMGSDDAIVQAARVSYGEGTKKLREDRGLIRYLMRHHHTTPFEMCEIKFHVRVPMDCWRQWIRHRTANVNEYSTRYSIAIDSAQRTNAMEWRTQSDRNKQGSGDYLDESIGQKLSDRESQLHEEIRSIYEERIELGVAREQARKDLPLSTYTEAYWKIDLHNLLHFLELRMDAHAQSEIRAYATVIGNEIVSRWCPITWEAFEDYRLGAITLSKLEVEIVRLLLSDKNSEIVELLYNSGLVRSRDSEVWKSREYLEIESKLSLLGHDLPNVIAPLAD